MDTSVESRRPTSFLDLPFEIRVLIYKLCLVASSAPPYIHDYDSASSEPLTFKGQYMLELYNVRYPASINLNILQTCKQIHAEAWPVLCSENTIHKRTPWLTSNFERIAPNVQSLDLCLEEAHHLTHWLQLLRYLRDLEPKNLRFLSITFYEDNGFPGKTRFGKSLTFARHTSRIEGLTKLTIEGYYGKHWPNFFRTHMDCEVVNYEGFHRSYLRYPTVSHVGFTNVYDFEELQAKKFLQYQAGTEDLDPANEKLLDEEDRLQRWFLDRLEEEDESE